MGSLRAGKGVHLSFEEGLIEWLDATVERVREVVTDYEEADIVNELVATSSWEYTSDKFGDKAYMAFSLENGNELRITVVLTSRGLRLDVREWYAA